MKQALRSSGLCPSEIEYINAHATGTVAGDGVEANAIREVFGDAKPPVSSTKGMTGHECWMAGASELAYSLLMMEHGFIAANRNLTTPDVACHGLNLVRETMAVRPRTVLSNSFGFGGTNASLVLKEWRQ